MTVNRSDVTLKLSSDKHTSKNVDQVIQWSIEIFIYLYYSARGYVFSDEIVGGTDAPRSSKSEGKNKRRRIDPKKKQRSRSSLSMGKNRAGETVVRGTRGVNVKDKLLA